MILLAICFSPEAADWLPSTSEETATPVSSRLQSRSSRRSGYCDWGRGAGGKGGHLHGCARVGHSKTNRADVL